MGSENSRTCFFAVTQELGPSEFSMKQVNMFFLSGFFRRYMSDIKTKSKRSDDLHLWVLPGKTSGIFHVLYIF